MHRILFLLTILAFADAAHAATRCPAVIGEMSNGTWKPSRGNYKCFTSARDAKRYGFIPAPTTPTAPVSFTGSTNQVTGNFTITRPSVMTYSYVGSDNFIVILRRASNGSWEDLLVNEIGNTAGVAYVPIGTHFLDLPYGDGQWSIVITPR